MKPYVFVKKTIFLSSAAAHPSTPQAASLLPLKPPFLNRLRMERACGAGKVFAEP